MNALRALALSAALGAGALIGTPFQATAQEPQGIRVVVDNHSFADMHVYAVQSGRRFSLGLAMGLSKRTFPLPRILVESERDIQLLADPVGPQTVYLSQVFFLYPGNQVNLTLENNLRLSWATVSDQPGPERKPVEPPADEADDSDDSDDPGDPT